MVGKASSNNVANGTGEKGKANLAKRHNVALAKGAGKKGQGMVLSSKQPLEQPQTVTFKQPLERRPTLLSIKRIANVLGV